MLNPCVTRFPQTALPTAVLCGFRTSAAWFARRSDPNRLPLCAENAHDENSCASKNRPLGAGQSSDRHQRPGRDHRRWVAGRAPDAGLRKRGMREDTPGDGISGKGPTQRSLEAVPSAHRLQF